MKKYKMIATITKYPYKNDWEEDEEVDIDFLLSTREISIEKKEYFYDDRIEMQEKFFGDWLENQDELKQYFIDVHTENIKGIGLVEFVDFICLRNSIDNYDIDIEILLHRI